MAELPNLPTGTVTFLFTDIEGSTKLLQRVGEQRYGEIRADHERLLRQAWTAHDGVEVDTQGDAFFVAFARASDALAAAAQAQRATSSRQRCATTRSRPRSAWTAISGRWRIGTSRPPARPRLRLDWLAT